MGTLGNLEYAREILKPRKAMTWKTKAQALHAGREECGTCLAQANIPGVAVFTACIENEVC